MNDRIEALSTGAPETTPRRVWRWIAAHKLLSAAAVLLVLWGGQYWLVHPADNPSPQKKIVVRGSFPYDRGWDLKIDVSYYTKNPICRQTVRAFGIFPQAEDARGAWRSLPVVRGEGNEYRFVFYEDAIVQGFCEWALRFVNYTIYMDGKDIQGGAILGFPGRFNVIRYGCSSVTMTHFKLPDRTPIKETGVACYEGENHWKDPARADHQIDFIWEDR